MRNVPYGFDIYLVNIKTMRTIAKIFEAFSEKLNFTINKQVIDFCTRCNVALHLYVYLWTSYNNFFGKMSDQFKSSGVKFSAGSSIKDVTSKGVHQKEIY